MMNRDAVVRVAKAIVRLVDARRGALDWRLPRGARFVVVVTGPDGAYVGVSSNTNHEDTLRILQSALTGAGLHFEAGPSIVDAPVDSD